uniref:Uncharacterized protein n=1 Tax=Romanomermis culicivorax TaxID=13658 RepID=A0A915HJI5_ROMCU
MEEFLKKGTKNLWIVPNKDELFNNLGSQVTIVYPYTERIGIPNVLFRIWSKIDRVEIDASPVAGFKET